MEFREIVGRESLQLDQANRDGIPHGQLGCGACGRREIVRAGFLFNSCVDNNVRLFSQVGIHIANHRYQNVSKIFDQRHQHLDFRAISTFADNHHYIFLLHNSKITVDGIRCVHEYGRSAG